jgi:hypothetical protein
VKDGSVGYMLDEAELMHCEKHVSSTAMWLGLLKSSKCLMKSGLALGWQMRLHDEWETLL